MIEISELTGVDDTTLVVVASGPDGEGRETVAVELRVEYEFQIY